MAIMEESFFQRVWEIVRKIPRGRVTTYGQIALMLGNPRMSRVVGYALRRSKGDLPWHRVVNREGRFSVEAVFPGGGELQRAMLLEEGVPFTEDGRVELKRCIWLGEDSSGKADFTN